MDIHFPKRWITTDRSMSYFTSLADRGDARSNICCASWLQPIFGTLKNLVLVLGMIRADPCLEPLQYTLAQPIIMTRERRTDELADFCAIRAHLSPDKLLSFVPETEWWIRRPSLWIWINRLWLYNESVGRTSWKARTRVIISREGAWKEWMNRD